MAKSRYIEEELSCKQEIGNTHDTHAVAVRNIIDGNIKVVEHVPICTTFDLN